MYNSFFSGAAAAVAGGALYINLTQTWADEKGPLNKREIKQTRVLEGFVERSYSSPSSEREADNIPSGNFTFLTQVLFHFFYFQFICFCFLCCNKFYGRVVENIFRLSEIIRLEVQKSSPLPFLWTNVISLCIF